jgi:hypothetical protein
VDDNGYVYENSHVLHPLDWDETKWAFTHQYGLNYAPVDFIAHNIAVRVFGLDGGRHHDVNLALHIINALLLFWVLKKATGLTSRSFVVAALFAVHPMNVENVAWISELKTLLSTAFFFLCLGIYAWYASKPQWRRMVTLCVFFGLGLLAKPQIITLPFVLLLWDYWPLLRIPSESPKTWLGHFKNGDLTRNAFVALLVEKAPLFFIVLVDVLLTLRAQRTPWVEKYTFLIRFGTAIQSYVVYLGRAVWPVNLALCYPHPGYELRWSEVYVSAVLLVLVTGFVLANRERRYLFVGWFWFVGTMVPMINLVQIDVTWVEDRYAYICFIGLFLMVCWGLSDLFSERHMPRSALPVLSAAVLLALAAATLRQVKYWSDPVTLWNRTLQVTRGNWRIEEELGTILIKDGRTEDGLRLYYRAHQERPQSSQILLAIAFVEQQRRNLKVAIVDYSEVLAVSKDSSVNAQILANMGHAYGDLGDATNALKCYREAQRLRSALPTHQP